MQLGIDKAVAGILCPLLGLQSKKDRERQEKSSEMELKYDQ